MRRLSCILLVALLFAAPASAADGEALAPDGELAGWLWPAAFGFFASRTAAWDFPTAYLIETPQVCRTVATRKDADTIAELVADLKDPRLVVKDAIAAELRRRTSQDFGYADAAPWLKRQRAVSKWAEWARKSRSQ